MRLPRGCPVADGTPLGRYGWIGEAGGFILDPFRLRIKRMQAAVREAAKLYEQETAWDDRRLGRSGYRKLFVTLTYAENSKGSPRDLSECIRLIRQWVRREGLRVRIVWVAESQKRGALHYHLLVWWPRRLLLPKLDMRGWWPHGSTQIARARNPVGYLVKYASKGGTVMGLARLRKGTRLYGYGGGAPELRETLRQALASRWLRKARDAEACAAWGRQLDREVEAQEREEAALLHAWWPDGHPPPGGGGESAYWDHVEREQAEWAMAQRRDALLHAGRSLLERVKGGVCDRVTGAFFESPWVVELFGKCVVVRPRLAAVSL